jgi:hypothetical protein
MGVSIYFIKLGRYGFLIYIILAYLAKISLSIYIFNFSKLIYTNAWFYR